MKAGPFMSSKRTVPQFDGAGDDVTEATLAALPAWAEDVLGLVAEGARLTAAQDRQVTLALDLRKERAAQIAARQAQQAAGMQQKAEKKRGLVAETSSEDASKPKKQSLLDQRAEMLATGSMVPLSTLTEVTMEKGADTLQRYNLYRTAEIYGGPSPGHSDRAPLFQARVAIFAGTGQGGIAAS